MQMFEFETPTLNEKGDILAWTKHSATQFTEQLGNDMGLELLVIPRGFFQMGSPHSTANHDESPQHLVAIQAFRMSKYPVTQGQWKAIMRKLPLPVQRQPSPCGTDLLAECTNIL